MHLGLRNPNCLLSLIQFTDTSGSILEMVEVAGVEPASVSTLPSALHA